MKSWLGWMGAFALVIFTAAPGGSHGVEGYGEQAEGYCVAAWYDDGEPMGYAAVEIRAPGGDVPFQTGRTDARGRFMFRPDRPGRWQAVVQDGMGHRLELDLEVGEAGAPPEKTEPARTGTSRLPGALAGLAVILGLTGLIYGWRARRKG